MQREEFKDLSLNGSVRPNLLLGSFHITLTRPASETSFIIYGIWNQMVILVLLTRSGKHS